MTKPPTSAPPRDEVREALAFLETRPDLIQEVEKRVLDWLRADVRRAQRRLGGKRPFTTR
ncbi:MAG: hypothetical protein AAF490_00580 [Chloroflexota bacterium]